MVSSVFPLLASNSATVNVNDDFLAADFDFSADNETPPNVMREIQIQITVASAVVVQLTFDAGVTWVDINNAATIDGVSTFTFFVTNTTVLNVRQVTSAGVVMTILVSG